MLIFSIFLASAIAYFSAYFSHSFSIFPFGNKQSTLRLFGPRKKKNPAYEEGNFDYLRQPTKALRVSLQSFVCSSTNSSFNSNTSEVTLLHLLLSKMLFSAANNLKILCCSSRIVLILLRKKLI